MKVVVIGDIMLDEYIVGSTRRISPEAPVPIVEVSNIQATLGGASNTAANISALGGSSVLIGGIGEDKYGEGLCRLLRDANVEYEPIYLSNSTTRKTRVISNNQQIVRLDQEFKVDNEYDTGLDCIDKVYKSIKETDCIIFSDYAKGFLSKSVCSSIIGIAKENNTLVIVDTKPSNLHWYKGCSVVKPNWKEALEMTGMGNVDMSEESIKKVAKALKARVKCDVLITLGSKGLYYSFYGCRKKPIFMPTLAKDIYDVSGAGDTVIASFALCMSKGMGVNESLIFANKAASIAVGKRGTSVVYKGEVLKMENN